MGAWVGAALTGLGALGGLFGSKKTTTDTSYNNTSTPTYDPKNQGFRDYLINTYMDLLKGAGSGDYQRAYTQTGLNNINRTSQKTSGAISDMITSRGLGLTTGGASPLADATMNRANQTASFLNNVPLLMDTRLQSILSNAGGYQASLPVGTTQNGTQHSVSTGGTSGVPGLIGGAAQGAAGALGTWAANQNFNNYLKKFPTISTNMPGYPYVMNFNEYSG